MQNTAPGGGTWSRSPGWPIPVWVHSNAPFLANTYCKMTEMLGPSCSPITTKPAISQADFGRRQLGVMNLSNGSSATTTTASSSQPTSGPAATPTFQDSNGNTITSAVCGSPYGLNIPGWENKQVYIIQTKNGNPQFSGLLSMPLSFYTSVCGTDEGTYILQAYDPANGAFIGGTTFTVLPAGSTGVPAAGTSSLLPASITSFFSGLTTTDWLLIGGAALLFLPMLTSGRR